MARPPNPAARELLLDAARAEFFQHGLERARVEDVTRRAGLSKGAFYLHFETKEQVFEELLQRFFGAMEDQVLRRQEAEERFAREHAGATTDLLEEQIAFEAVVDAETLEALWRNRHMLSLLDSGGPRYAAVLSEFRRRIRAVTRKRLADKQAAGRIRPDVDPEVVSDILVGTYEGLARRMLDLDRKPDLLGWLRSFLHILYEGIRLPPAARSARRPPPAARRGRAARPQP